ncbi:MAG: collagen binding domain-containing protein, partial [Planctomycetota bacterium]
TRTDSRGRFRATGLVAERNYMVLARRGPTLWVSSESVHAGSHPTLTMPASFFVRGRLVLPEGEPARGGRIGFVNTQRPFDEAMDQLFHPVDEEGRFKLELAAATYGIFVQHPKGQGLLDPVEVEEATDLGALTVPAGVPLRITVLSSWDESPVDLPMISDVSVDVLVESKNLDPEIWRKKIREAAASRLPPRPVYEERNVVLLERLEPGHHRLMVSRQGFVQGFLDVDLEAGQPKEMTLHLDPASRVYLTVLNADGTPAADQYFILNPGTPGKLSSARLTTGPDGLAVFQELAPGRYRFLFQSPEGYLQIHGDLDVRPGENHLQVVLPGRCNLTVAVSGVAGPVQGQQVRLAALGEGFAIPDEEVQTDADGTARFPDLWTGPYRVTVERPGRPAQQRKIELKQAEERLEIGFREGTTLSGRLEALGAGPLENATVSLHGFGADPSQAGTADYEQLERTRGLSESSELVHCKADGSFQFQGVEPGVYRLFGTAAGYVYSRPIAVRVGASPVKGIAIPLEPEARLILRVKGLREFAARKELDFVEIRLATSGGEEALNLVRESEKDGEVVFEKVEPGFYRVRTYRGTLRGGLKKTLIEEIPIELPAGSTTLEWDAPSRP